MGHKRCQIEGPEEPVYSLLHSLQSSYHYRTPQRVTPQREGEIWDTTTIGGAGSAIGASSFLDVYVNNLLNASITLEQKIYNLRMQQLEEQSEETPIYEVSGWEPVLAYRIVYIPGLLLGGLISLTLATAIVAGLQISSWKSIAHQRDRVMDGLRFVTDFATAMRKEENLADVGLWDEKQLERWGSRTKFRYVAQGDKSLSLKKVNVESGD
ncbi:hypothetical protein P154DRAFT_524268 [Amniculicola lignicola CBS 123094]|uniref:Uncharacterized protein n=1 Tax=Amniculicola lignicola CBS 123094 TaxID=1392246 RepID=A0A6A5WKH5_9PLEO|nr:hypothetical protein P154DRAFT_524268 [Amniculicola lignicola CBS 123094]